MHAFLVTFAIDVARVTVWLILLLITFVPLERIFAETSYQIWRREFGLDLVWYFGNGVLTTTLLAVGLSRVVPHVAANLPLWQRMLATLVVGEFGFYWGHRWSHEIPPPWRFHAIHHTAEQVDWLTNTRGHPVDIVFTRLCGFVPIYLLGLAQADMTPHSVAVSLLMSRRGLESTGRATRFHRPGSGTVRRTASSRSGLTDFTDGLKSHLPVL